MLTLLEICQRAASRLGLRRPQAVVGSTDLTAQILLELANMEGEELAKWHDWQALITERTWTTVAQVVQTSAIPSDFDRMVYNPEIWNRTLSVRYTGPTPQRVWQQLQVGGGAGVAGRWRLKGGQLNIFPAPTAGQTGAYEYISKNFCEDSDGNAQSSFMADDDVPLLPDFLFSMGMVWRFQQQRGYAIYAENMATYERAKERAAAADRSTSQIRPSPQSDWPPDPGITIVTES